MGVSQSRLARRANAMLRLLLGYPLRMGTHISPLALPIDSIVDRTAALDSYVRFYRSNLGRYSYVGRGSFIESTEIGAFCSIAGDVLVGGASHPINHPSTSPVFCKGGNILCCNLAQADFEPLERTVIENDVWIGSGAKIRAGLTIKTGAVIGMGSVLTKNVGCYEIWAGNPAHLIRKRFDEDAIQLLLDSHWWEWDEEKLRSEASFFERVYRGCESFDENSTYLSS